MKVKVKLSFSFNTGDQIALDMVRAVLQGCWINSLKCKPAEAKQLILGEIVLSHLPQYFSEPKSINKIQTVKIVSIIERQLPLGLDSSSGLGSDLGLDIKVKKQKQLDNVELNTSSVDHAVDCTEALLL